MNRFCNFSNFFYNIFPADFLELILYCHRPRVCICNKNVPNVIANVTSVLSDRGHNVDDLINKSRGEYAYKAIDLTGDVPTEETMAELSSVDGVLSCRLLNSEGELWQSMVGAE